MGKYEFRMCSCRRIHAIKKEKINKALKNNKNFLLICAGCGKASLIGADIAPDWYEPEKNCYYRYTTELSHDKDKTINDSDFISTKEQKGIEEILYSYGHEIPMMTGMYANGTTVVEGSGKPCDNWFPDFWKIEREGITFAEISAFIEQWRKDRITVNMQRFISQTPEDVLEELSLHYYPCFDWSGTKYERKEDD